MLRVFFTLNSSFYPTRRHPAHPDQCACRFFIFLETQALWSRGHDTEKVHCNVVRRVDNAITCRRTGYDRYGTEMLPIQVHALIERKHEGDKETNLGAFGKATA